MPGGRRPQPRRGRARRLPRAASPSCRGCGCGSRSGSRWPPVWAAGAPTPPRSCAPRTGSSASRSTPSELRALAARLGSDVPSQVEPRHALVAGVGELVEPVELPAFGALLVPQREGLSTAAVYAEFDRLGGGRAELDLDATRSLAGEMRLLPALDNDLQPAALSLRPELHDTLASLKAAGALGALVSGSGPTCFGLFEDRGAAEAAAARIEGAIPAALRRLSGQPASLESSRVRRPDRRRRPRRGARRADRVEEALDHRRAPAAGHGRRGRAGGLRQRRAVRAARPQERDRRRGARRSARGPTRWSA